MGIVEDVDAIYADPTLTPDAKAKNAAAAKAVAWRSALLGVGVWPITWTFTANGDTWEITLLSVTVTGSDIAFTGVAKKNSVVMRHNSAGAPLWPIVFGNPPLLLADASGAVQRNGRSYRLDIVDTARTLFARTVAGARP